MYSRYNNTLTSGIAAIVILLSLQPAFCQQNRKTDQNQQAKTQTITAEQTRQIKKILSNYNAAKITAADAKAIQEKFRESGIHAGPESNNAITAAGFDPEKLRTLAPPPNNGNIIKQGSPSMDERIKTVRGKICKPLLLTSDQTEEVCTAFTEFYSSMDKLAKSSANQQLAPDKLKVEPMEKSRDAKIKKVVSTEQFKKYVELEKASRPNRPERKEQKQSATN